MALVLFSFADNSRTTWHIGNPPKWYDSSDDILSETLSLDLHLIVEARESKQTSCRTDRQQLPNCNPNQMIVPGPTNQSHRYAFDRIWWDISESASFDVWIIVVTKWTIGMSMTTKWPVLRIFESKSIQRHTSSGKIMDHSNGNDKALRNFSGRFVLNSDHHHAIFSHLHLVWLFVVVNP